MCLGQPLLRLFSCHALFSVSAFSLSGNASARRGPWRTLRTNPFPGFPYTGAEMDGKAIPEEQTARAKGSLILTVKKAYMETLAAGNHKLKINFRDSSVEMPVTIHAAEPTPTRSPTPKPTPKTGDTSDLILWGSLVLLGLAGMIVVIKQYHSRKRKK